MYDCNALVFEIVDEACLTMNWCLKHCTCYGSKMQCEGYAGCSARDVQDRCHGLDRHKSHGVDDEEFYDGGCICVPPVNGQTNPPAGENQYLRRAARVEEKDVSAWSVMSPLAG